MIECLLPPIFANRPLVMQVMGAVQQGARAAGRKVAIVAGLTDRCRVAVIWGAGHPEMLRLMQQTVARGVPVIAWDGAYWHRGTHYRFSINAPHPQAVIMARAFSDHRFKSFRVEMREDWNRSGPVVLVGQGIKCARMYDEHPGEWERAMALAIRQRWPDRPIHFRPRPQGSGHCKMLTGCITRTEPRINDVIRSASLVVTRHSNVAVDAIVAGIPAVSESGAAAAVCPRRLEDAGPPLDEKARRQFLANLAHFQWSLAELRTAETWGFIESMALSTMEAADAH